MKTSELLEQALEKLGPNGEWWADHAPNPTEYPMEQCSATAIGSVCRGAGALNAVYTAICFMEEALGLDAFSLTKWNDSRGDFSEIRAGFERAIALAKQQEAQA